MGTECTQREFAFQEHSGREVIGKFDGGKITTDAGAVLLREVEKRLGIVRQFAACFTDHRDGRFVEHSVEELIGQRVYGLALGYEDLNDHEDLREDPLLATVTGKRDPSGQDRLRERDRGKALAGKSTLNRLELTGQQVEPKERYKKIVAEWEKIQRYFVAVYLQRYETAPKRIVLDLDDTDDRIHGTQEGRFFHGYYGDYCYLPLYVFSGDHLLSARLRESNGDHAKGAVEEVSRIVGQIREQWPEVRILVRGDSGFCREELMHWCEANGVGYLLGLARNSRLEELLSGELALAKAMYQEKGQSARVYKDFVYETRESWSGPRRVIGKAEHLAKGANPRFVVTSVAVQEMDARTVYEKEYCARGEMENRIKEQQLQLFADRTSTHWMRSNQLRLWFSSVAYTLMHAMRELGLKGTEMARAQCGTLRLKLLKLGAQIRLTTRRVIISFCSAFPYQRIFQAVYDNLKCVRVGPTWIPMRC